MSTTASESSVSVVGIDNSQQSANAVEPRPRASTWGMLRGFMVRLLITYFVYNLFRRSPTPVPQSGQPYSVGPATNLYAKGAPMELYVYLSEEERFNDFNNSKALFWHQGEITFGDWEGGPSGDGSYTKEGVIPCSQNLMNNGSLYLHVYIVKPGFSPDPNAGNLYSKKFTINKSKMMTKFKRRRLSRTVNLLTGQTDAPADLIANESTPDDVKYLPPMSHWHPNLTIHIVDDHSPWVQGSVPAPLNQFIDFYPPTNQYYPIVHLNDYWNLNEHYMPINESTPYLNVYLTVAPISLFRWQLYAAQSMRKSWFNTLVTDGMSSEVEDEEVQDTLKKTLVETSPVLLAVTVIVSIVHSVFELLAFKNDIQFWQSRDSLEGLSVRSVFFNVFQSLIVVLYVLDHNTNFVIKVSVLIGLAIEVWKIKKVLTFRVDNERKIFGLFPYVHMDYQASYVESETKKFDQMAFRYLSWLLFPMLAAYAGYSLVYQEHRGWYSWVLSMLYGFLLTFGFITMTPQLFINYKMKSVAHLPWRMLTYKALNTFIDDLFAFVIRMPTLYRLGCLRDDIIFFIYLYQRWIYPMDPNRVNEFGVSKQMLDERDLGVTAANGVSNLPLSDHRADGDVFTSSQEKESEDVAEAESTELRKRQVEETKTSTE